MHDSIQIDMSKDKTILLVEDNPDDELLTKRAIKKNNIANKLDIVRDGAEALDYIFAKGEFKDRDIDDLPQLVLLDLNLPKISGLDVLKEIKSNEQTKSLPVVILTSSKEESDISNGYGYGANSYIRKPVDFEQFNEAIQQLGIYWLVLNEIPN